MTKAQNLHRWAPSLRTELMLLLGALIVVATASLGSVAFSSSREIIEGAAVREVGIAANARKQALLTVLIEQKARATAVLKTASLGCAPDETPCLRRVLQDFVATGGAAAARLTYRRGEPITAGVGAAALASITAPDDDQLARFDFDDQQQPYYVMVTRALTRDGEMAVTVRGDMQAIHQMFSDRYGLGQSGQTLLADAKGRFLTVPVTEDGSPGPLPAQPETNVCSTRTDGEVLDRDYRGVPVIHGFRRLVQVGGACVVTQIDQAEAFAPTSALRTKVIQVSGLLAVLAIPFSFLFAQLVSRPINQLSDRARLLQAGDYDSEVPVRGPAEIRTFALTFEAMAHSLKDSHTKLLQSSEQISNILESISEGFFAFDRSWNCTYVNRKAVALARVPKEQLLGKKLWELVPRTVSGKIRAVLQQAATDNIPAHLEQYYAPLEVWLEVIAYPSRDGFAIFARDVTERKRFEQQLQQKQKLESLGLLAGGIAHDFNNLLTGIMGNASMVLEDLPPVSPMRESLEDVVSAADRAGGLTQQLLAYAGKGRFVIGPVDLSALVRETSNLIKTSIPKTVDLRLALGDPMPAIEADASQIQQLVMNLVINGAEAIGESNAGSVTVTTRLQLVDDLYLQQMLPHDDIRPGNYVMLEVTDTGTGMSEATLAKIFDPFFTTKFTGRGLGLAAALGIVRGHKGSLEVDSTPGTGSRFRVLFPVSEGAVVQKPVALDVDLRGNGTILVIDDEEIVRRTAKSTLERYGYTVVVAENGKVGLDILLEPGVSIDVVLLDLTMPVLSGEETLRHIRSVFPDLPVVLSSGYNELEAIGKLVSEKQTSFIQKPYAASQLARQVKTALS
ncbi:MAG: response regulator [Bryobacteraceae bacterium]